ncbi:MAG: Gfo/Idh/MocA family oxidoreductase [Phycisphaerae bacterium]
MKQIRLGIIGCGGFVQYHLKPMAQDVPEFRIVALCDIIRAHAEHHRKLYCPRRRVPIYLNYKDMLAKEKLDAIIVSTPHTLHFRHAYDSLAAGCHVMIEKPMVTSSVHARRLVSRSRKKGLALLIAIQGTYTDTFAYARHLLADGTMGELQLVTGLLAQDWMQGTRGKWRQDPKLSGGGQLYDSCAHVLSAMMYLVNSPVREVFCIADNRGTRVDINAVASLRFANGAMATVTSGGNCPTWKSHLTLQGVNARMEISPHGGDFLVNGRGLAGDIKKVPRGWKIPTVSPSRNFADVILGKAEPRCGGDVGILLADLMDALYASAAAGKPVKVK